MRILWAYTRKPVTPVTYNLTTYYYYTCEVTGRVTRLPV